MQANSRSDPSGRAKLAARSLGFGVAPSARMKAIMPRLAELFGGVFVWWYEVCYRTMLLPTGWESAREIDWLYGWLKKRASKSQWERWQQVPMAELAKREKEASGAAAAIPMLAVVAGEDAGSDHHATG